MYAVYLEGGGGGALNIFEVHTSYFGVPLSGAE